DPRLTTRMSTRSSSSSCAPPSTRPSGCRHRGRPVLLVGVDIRCLQPQAARPEPDWFGRATRGLVSAGQRAGAWEARRDTGHGAPTRAPLRHGSAVLAQPAARVGSLSRTAFAGRETHPQDSAYDAPGEGDTLASVSAGPRGLFGSARISANRCCPATPALLASQLNH